MAAVLPPATNISLLSWRIVLKKYLLAYLFIYCGSTYQTEDAELAGKTFPLTCIPSPLPTPPHSKTKQQQKSTRITSTNPKPTKPFCCFWVWIRFLEEIRTLNCFSVFFTEDNRVIGKRCSPASYNWISSQLGSILKSRIGCGKAWVVEGANFLWNKVK